MRLSSRANSFAMSFLSGDSAIIEKLSLRDSVPLLSWGGETRMSLAGAQDKAALFLKNGQLYRPVNGAPSNVIIKAGINDYSLNEYVTTKLASLLGLNVPETVLADYMSMIIENMVSSIPEAFAKAGSEL